jgi:heme exporter protein D
MSASDKAVYRPAATLVRWVTFLYVTRAAILAAVALLNVYQIALLDVFQAGGTVPLALAESQDLWQRVLAGIEMSVDLPPVILFMMWVYRASKNARALGAEGMEYTPGWSVGWFFVPVASLIMPYLALKELWKASSPTPVGTWRQVGVSSLLPVWWTVWILGAVTNFSSIDVLLGRKALTWYLRTFSGAQRTFPGVDWTGHLAEFFYGRLFADCVWIAVAVLTIVVVRRITRLQTARAASLKALARQAVRAQRSVNVA